VLATIVVPLSVVPFLPFLHPPAARSRALVPVRRVLDTTRTLNAYHLFASMTLVRREPVIEGSGDGETWRPYEFRWKPGDPQRRPAFVAPHQPRVDFQLWFLLLGDRHGERYFETLLLRLLTDPPAVAALFVADPFPEMPPRFVRVAFYRYRFTDRATRAATGAWWTRDLEGYSRTLTNPGLPAPLAHSSSDGSGPFGSESTGQFCRSCRSRAAMSTIRVACCGSLATLSSSYGSLARS
jgi:hypothetical protein